MTKIILIRHCKTEGNASGKLQGHYNDSSFTEEGIQQLTKLKETLKNEKIHAVFCSDLGRALKTAEEIANSHNLNVKPLKELREAHIGDWENMNVKDALQKWMEYYEEQKSRGISREIIRPPNGENAWDHQKRIFKTIKIITETYPNETVVIVGHSGTNKVIIGTFEGRDPDDFYSISQDNACLNFLESDGKNFSVQSINDTGYLNEKNRFQKS